MTKDEKDSLYAMNQTVSELLELVSEFSINDLHYLILSTNNFTEIQDSHSLLNTFLQCLGVEQFTEVDRFELNHQICFIVEIQSRPSTSELDFINLLTARELQIATLVAQGQPNKKIAKQLHISEWTVATHLRRIFAKLHVDSRAAMVYRCAPLIQSRSGLVMAKANCTSVLSSK